MAAKTAKAGFEQALERLEEIVGQMQGGELTLENRLKRFEEGVMLVRDCAKQLEGAARKIEVLIKSSGGKPQTRLFDEVCERLREVSGGDYAVDGEESKGDAGSR
ncbi:MAG: exodeoxyribonuclease VII small subunit [Candidatus Omnitrophica bacterium]|nr:exodeoxyribonuclease VII small subunit [Candidatus Omnitrophota bacterium]